MLFHGGPLGLYKESPKKNGAVLRCMRLVYLSTKNMLRYYYFLKDKVF